MGNFAIHLMNEVELDTFYLVDPVNIESSERLVKHAVLH
ncbi:unannotated protein [freshwater metagenome]|uniref:Unannotated protein n=1 Tax=freshwater metagenome TaxID=449393 RepID=A0A6J6RIZ2_9ZZZZ